MNGTHFALRAIHRGEVHMARKLARTAERHHAEHEVHHVATDLAHLSRVHVHKIADTGRLYDLHLGGLPESPSGIPADLREWVADMLGGRPEPALLLLHDLRGLYLAASDNSLSWEMLAQTAQATRDDRLLSLASTCHPQTLRQIRWANTMIKNLSPQILSSV